ncbi:hypothetical protein AURDEDRAFT_146559 [Auricularia subglabra TFB-10046 SS5]|uniref:Nudix hydrolase domain-containing protein n=1 Tax=Auricularia subglabra (strain TFB-10046 / SS5) TaxID=717982 RepID=J0WXB3_AURST|nr:hypothetical protein AURDEDRAFT_146559 [Auricularia subglabra TFB-10046 SS5]
MAQTTKQIIKLDPRVLPIHTEYTNHRLGTLAYSAADLAFQSGAVIINKNGKVLLLEDIKSGRIELPRSGIPRSLEDLFTSPLEFAEEKTGLSLERLPLLKITRRYRDPNVAKWGLLEQELVFGDSTTTNPFSVGIDIVYLQHPDFPDSRQSITSWYAGFVREHPPSGSAHNGVRLHFMSIEEAIQTVQDPYCDHVAAAALTLFEAVWKGTRDRVGIPS